MAVAAFTTFQGQQQAAVVVSNAAPAAHAIGLTFFGPTILGTSVTLLRFPGVSGSSAAVGVTAGITVLGIAACTLWVFRRQRPTDVARPAWIDRLRDDVLVSFYDGARDKDTWYVRMYVLEDIAAAYVTAALSGLYPSTAEGCTALCFALLAVATAHSVYVLIVHPYEQPVEQWLSVCNAFIVVGVAGCSIWTQLSNDSDDAGTIAMGYCILAANAFYFVQLMVLATTAATARLPRQPFHWASPLSDASPEATLPRVSNHAKVLDRQGPSSDSQSYPEASLDGIQRPWDTLNHHEPGGPTEIVWERGPERYSNKAPKALRNFPRKQPKPCFSFRRDWDDAKRPAM
jgi:hypothetical protein